MPDTTTTNYGLTKPEHGKLTGWDVELNGDLDTIDSALKTNADAVALKANTSSLATVATSGAYADLSGKPSLFSGAYSDLSGKPTLAVTKASVSHYFVTAYDSTTGAFSTAQPAYGDITGTPSLATVATSGAYADLSGKPSIPTSFTWDVEGNAAADLSISNANYKSTFNQTSAVAWLWANTTVATVSTTNASPLLELAANYWATGAVTGVDLWTVGIAALTAGLNSPSTLTFTHTGSTGSAAVNVPLLNIGGTDAGISRLGAASLAIGNGTALDYSGALTASSYNAISALLDSFVSPFPTTAARQQQFSVGFRFQVVEPITITRLGRLYVTGNTQNHGVNLWISTNTSTPLANATILAASASDGNGFKWVTITPVTLTPGNTYAIALDEFTSGDTWKDSWTPTLNGQFASVIAAYNTSLDTYPNSSGSSGAIYDTPAMMYTAEATLSATGTLYVLSISTSLLSVGGITDLGNLSVAGSTTVAAITVGNILVPSGTDSVPNVGIITAPNYGFGVDASGNFFVTSAGTRAFQIAVTSGAAQWGSAHDAGISRLGAASLAIGNGTASNTSGTLTLANLILSATQSPASNAAGTAGQLAYDGSYIYTCVASGSWRRAATTGSY